jgi:hypothetical protein
MRVSGLLKTVAVLLLTSASGLAAVEFAPELYSFGWHGLHRGVARFKSETRTTYELRVPPRFSAFLHDECSISVAKEAGPIRSRVVGQGSSKMSFSACRIYMTVKEIEANAPKLKNELGIETIPRETIAVAGQELRCYERLGSRPTAQGTPVSAVDCVPVSSEGELSAYFEGSSEHLPEFYNLLRTVKRPDID